MLDLLGYNPYEFLLEPSEEFLQDIKYNCVHMLDYVCNRDLFKVQYCQFYWQGHGLLRSFNGLEPGGPESTIRM